MFNFLIKIVFSFYVWYQLKSPVKKGNAFFGRLIKNIRPIKYNINGLFLKLNPVSYIDFHLIAFKKHDDEIKAWIDEFLKPEELFLDIGANIGYFSLYAAKMRGAKVISFEPSKRELSRFYKNIAINELNNITVYPFALGSENLKVKLNVSDYQNPGKNSIINDEVQSETIPEMIEVDALGNLITSNLISKIKLIKIDVEGYENNVLMGLSSIMGLLNETVFIIEITSYVDRDPEMDETNRIYEFFKNFHYEAQIGKKFNEQYNEVFIKK